MQFLIKIHIYNKNNNTWRNLYHTPYQPSINISPRAVGPRAVIGRGLIWGVIQILPCIWGVIQISPCNGVFIIYLIKSGSNNVVAKQSKQRRKFQNDMIWKTYEQCVLYLSTFLLCQQNFSFATLTKFCSVFILVIFVHVYIHIHAFIYTYIKSQYHVTNFII